MTETTQDQSIQPKPDADGQPSESPQPESPQRGADVGIRVCEQCDWTFLLPQVQTSLEPASLACPHCQAAVLEPVDQSTELMELLRPAELFLPYTVSQAQIDAQIQAFTGGIPFPPADLTRQNLLSRLQRVFIPIWLVDANVTAEWRAEAGFNYQVVSHQDRYDQNLGRWVSREVREDRVRWEPRLGVVTRHYPNTAVPSLAEQARIVQSIGDFNLSSRQAYQPQPGCFIRLPNRTTRDAWGDAVPAIQQRVSQDCQAACSANHMREFSWQPQFSDLNWSLLLLPLLTTYYKDDQGVPQTLVLHGQTGRLSGSQRSSRQHAQKIALGILAAAVVLLILAILAGLASVLAPPLLVLAAILLTVAGFAVLAAGIPLLITWSFNRRHQGIRPL